MRIKLSRILWGLFFITVGVGSIGNIFGLWSFTVFFPGWWTLFIIIPSLISVVHYGFKHWNVLSLLIGVVFLLAANGIGSYRMFFPVILVYIGISIIFCNFFKRFTGIVKPFIGHGSTDYSASFSSQTINYPNDRFTGANISSDFGSLTFDLRNAIIESNAVINAETSFGSIEIYVPMDVNIAVSGPPSTFGSITNKAFRTTNPNYPTLTVNGNCSFGSIEII